MCLLVVDKPCSLNQLGHLICYMAGKQKPVSRLHLVGKSHECQRIATEGCKKTKQKSVNISERLKAARVRKRSSSLADGNGYCLGASKPGGSGRVHCTAARLLFITDTLKNVY